MNKPKRIMIIGRPGGGKSTFALKLQKILQLPLYHLDKYFYIDNWEPRDYAEFLSIQQKIVDGEHWIIDGNSTKSYETRYAKADLCLYFNYPLHLCYWRVFKRLFIKRIDIDDRAPNCHETVRLSLLKYMYGFEKRVFSSLKNLRGKYPDVLFIEIRDQNDLNTVENQLLKLLL